MIVRYPNLEIEMGFHRYVLARDSDVSLYRGDLADCATVDPWTAQRVLTDFARDDRWSAGRLRDFFASITTGYIPPLHDHEILERMCLALDKFGGGFGGFPRLVLKSVPRPTYQYVFTPAPPESVAPPEPEPDHWIELEIVDEDGMPAPGVPFYLVWSSGRVQHGRADASGIGRVEDLGTGDFDVRMAVDDVAWRLG